MARQDHSEITAEQKDRFLERLAAGMSVQAAADTDAFKRRLYRLRAKDETFATEWATAYEEGSDALEAEAQRRAMEGVPRRQFKDGELVREEIVYSDMLLVKLLGARRPSVFKDNAKLEVTGKNDGPIQVEHRGVKLSDVFRVAREAGVEPAD